MASPATNGGGHFLDTATNKDDVAEATVAGALVDPLDGIPQYMLRKARVVTASRDPMVLRAFILQNLDQGDEFWATELQAEELSRARSQQAAMDVVEKLRRAPEEMLASIGVSSQGITQAAAALGLARTISAPAGRLHLGSGEDAAPDPASVPVPEDDMEHSQRKAASVRWRALRHLIKAASSLQAATKVAPAPTAFGELADLITANKAQRDQIDAKILALLAAMRNCDQDNSGWLSQVDSGDVIEVDLATLTKAPEGQAAESSQTNGESSSPLWTTAVVQKAEYGACGKVIEVVAAVDKSDLPKASPHHERVPGSRCAVHICGQNGGNHGSGKRNRTLVTAADGSSTAVPSISFHCKEVREVVRPVGLTERRLGAFPHGLQKGDPLEVFLRFKVYAQPPAAAAAAGEEAPILDLPEVSSPEDRWVNARVADSSPWVGGAKLVEVVMPESLQEEIPHTSDFMKTGLAMFPLESSLLVWNVGKVGEESVRQAVDDALRSALAAESEETLKIWVRGVCLQQHSASPNNASALVSLCAGNVSGTLEGWSGSVGERLSNSILEGVRGKPLEPDSPGKDRQADGGPPSACWLKEVRFLRRPIQTPNTFSESHFSPFLSSSTAATLSKLPGRAQHGGSVFICLETVPKKIRCAAASQVVVESPEKAVDCRVLVHGKVLDVRSSRPWVAGEVVAYLPKYQKHVVMVGTNDVKMVDMSGPTFTFDLASPHVSIYAENIIARPGTHLRSCVVCYEPYKVSDISVWAEFCFETYHVDGHAVDIRGPRHPAQICRKCLKTHCESSLNEGRLYVRCPAEGCGRALQIRELQGIVDESIYDTLMFRLREAEEQEQEVDDDVSFAKLEDLKLCPQCKVRIEKNAGCMHMQCYRCGHSFEWSTAESPKPKTATRAIAPVSLFGPSAPVQQSGLFNAFTAPQAGAAAQQVGGVRRGRGRIYSRDVAGAGDIANEAPIFGTTTDAPEVPNGFTSSQAFSFAPAEPNGASLPSGIFTFGAPGGQMFRFGQAAADTGDEAAVASGEEQPAAHRVVTDDL